MAVPPFISINLPLPLSPSPSSSPLPLSPSFLPLIQTRKHLPSRFSSFKLKVHLSSHTRQSSNGEFQEAESQPDTFENKKKKKKKKLRPNFYEQTLERWSVRISSQRSKFPWQEQMAEKKTDVRSSAHAGLPSDPTCDNCENLVLWADGAKPTNSYLDSNPNSRNQMSKLDHNEEGVKSRLDLIVEIMDNPLGNSTNSSVGFHSTSSDDEVQSSVCVDEDPPITKNIGFSLGIRNGAAPWVHGAKTREAHLNSVAKTQSSLENFEFHAQTERQTSTLGNDSSNSTLDAELTNANDFERHTSSNCAVLPSLSIDKTPPITETSSVAIDPIETHSDLLQTLEFSTESGQSMDSLIVEQLKNTSDPDSQHLDVGIPFDKSDKGHLSNSDNDSPNLMGSVLFPWERDSGAREGAQLHKSNSELAERTIPELELRRLRNAALRMKERIKVGSAGVTEAVVESIHKKWKEAEVVKLRFEGPPSFNMKRTHEILEMKTGGLVIWRSGSSVVLYRGMTYKLACVRAYSNFVDTDSSHNNFPSSNDTRVSERSGVHLPTSSENPSEGSTNTFDIDKLLDQLGPRYKDWSGRNPLPVDADLLPGVVRGYKPPYRILPYKTRRSLKNRQMTSLRRLARTMAPHFALGRNREHQGLASAMVKLWEKSAIAKIAIKRGVQNTCNDRMAEEIKKLTGGVLLSRNKDYMVFYRGNDYLTPPIRDALVEKQKLATIQQDEEEVARLRASAIVVLDAKTANGPLVAGTLAETVEANSRWGNQPSSEDREKMMNDLALAKYASLVRYLERKQAAAKAKVRKAEKALAKVQEYLIPAKCPSDLEIVTDEERFLFRKMGLKMSAFLLLGRREVFDGVVQNMHLHWKHRELVKIIVKRKTFPQAKHIAISLEAESGGVLISLDKTSKGYAIIVYRGKNYHRPRILRPRTLLTRRQALARSIELQRREALNHHISDLRERIQMLKAQLDQMKSNKKSGNEHLVLNVDDAFLSDDDIEDEGEEAYLETYTSSNKDDDDDASIDEF